MHNSISRSVKMNINGKTTVKQIILQYHVTMLKNIYTKEYSEIVELFYGIYVSELTSSDGTIVHSVRPENYSMLDLELPKTYFV